MFFDKTIQNFKNINRAREILQVMVKYGFEDIVINTPLSKLIPDSRKLTWMRQTKPIFDYSRWERIRLVTEELGPTFVKFAQVMSNRPDVLPLQLIKELAKLQNEVPPFGIDEAKKIIETETGKPIDELFEYFLDKPIGSASIGQVHRAKFKNNQENGAEIVVKVQRPNIRNLVETDLAIMSEIASRTEGYLEKQGITNIGAVVEAFEKTMHKELNYLMEARNMAHFAAQYNGKLDGRLDFHVPKVYSQYSTDKVLISEYISGCKISDLETMKSWGINPEKIAEDTINLYLTKIFKYGLFHADPHPGNVLIRKDGKICLIDYGMVGNLMQRDKFAFAGIFVGLAQKDARKIATSLRQLAIEDSVVNKRAFEYDLNEILEDHIDSNLKDSSITEVGTRLQQIIYKNKLQVPRSVFLIIRTLAILEGIGKQIHPDLNIYKLVKPYGANVIKEQFSTGNMTEEVLFRLLQFDSLSQKLPNEFYDILRKTRKGELEVNLNIQRWEYLADKLNKTANKFVLVILISALIIGSSIMVSSNHISGEVMSTEGYPYISIVGFFLAFILSIWLFWKLIRS